MSEFRPGGFQMLPLIIKNLLIINGLVFLAQETLLGIYGIKLETMFGLYYWGSDLFRPHQFVTHLFLHGSFGHLFSNMFMLWMVGSVLENVWGPKRFLIFYIICGLGAAFCHMGVLTYENYGVVKAVHNFNLNPSYDAFNALYQKYNLGNYSFWTGTTEIKMRDLREAWSTKPPQSYEMIGWAKSALATFPAAYSNIPTVGASGAVFGALFAFGYLFPNSIMILFPLPIPIKVKYFVGGYILIELFLGFQNSAGDNVAHFAHLGGVLFSYILLKFWNRRNRRTLY